MAFIQTLLWNSIWILSYFRHWYKVIASYFTLKGNIHWINSDGTLGHKKLWFGISITTDIDYRLAQLTFCDRWKRPLIFAVTHPQQIKEFLQNYGRGEEGEGLTGEPKIIEYLLDDQDISHIFRAYLDRPLAPWEGKIKVSDILLINSVRFDVKESILELIDQDINSTFTDLKDGKLTLGEIANATF